MGCQRRRWQLHALYRSGGLDPSVFHAGRVVCGRVAGRRISQGWREVDAGELVLWICLVDVSGLTCTVFRTEASARGGAWLVASGRCRERDLSCREGSVSAWQAASSSAPAARCVLAKLWCLGDYLLPSLPSALVSRMDQRWIALGADRALQLSRFSLGSRLNQVSVPPLPAPSGPFRVFSRVFITMILKLPSLPSSCGHGDSRARVDGWLPHSFPAEQQSGWGFRLGTPLSRC